MEAIEFVNIIRPHHDRTSCDDQSIGNGFYSRGVEWYGRYTRCMYLEILQGGPLPEGFDPNECQG